VGVACDGANATWALQSVSPCINAGTQVGDLPATDLAGGDRVYSGVVDLGAYENRSDLPLITAVPSRTIDTGFVPVNTASATAFEIANTGALDFEVREVRVADPNGAFSIATPIQNHPLSPGDSVPVQVMFRPQQEKAYTDSLIVDSTSSNVPSLRIALRGMGVTGTIVPAGEVSGIWSKAGSPYTVTGDINVAKNRTLTIEPGVVVRFAGRFRLTVGYRATLQATGTPQDRIVFTAVDTQEGWFGIRFVNSAADDVLKHCTLEYARKPRSGAGGFENLYGGAILCHGSWDEEPGTPLPTSPTIDSCLLARNRASTGGAIMCYNGSRAIITNNTIVDNAADIDGGGIALYYSACTITNNVIARNDALAGGGIMTWMGVPSIRNNTIMANRPSAMLLDSTTTQPSVSQAVTIENNIVWKNEIWMSEGLLPGEYRIRFNDIQGGWEGEGNLDVDPLFADAENGDYHLRSRAGRWDSATGQWLVDEVTSLCIDAGNPATSFAAEPQPSGQRVNLGAYGGTEQASKSSSGSEGP
jgi:hypothetical protein